MKQTVSFFKYIRRFLRFTSDLALTRKPSQNNTHTRFSVSESSCCLSRVAKNETNVDQCRILRIHQCCRLNLGSRVYLEDCTLLFGIVVVTDITAAISCRCIHLWKGKKKKRERERKSEFCSPFVQVPFTNEINERIMRRDRARG